MIVINAKFSIKPEKRNEFLAEVKNLIEATKKEDGCLSYKLFESIDTENEFVMIENWRDQALAEGFETEGPVIIDIPIDYRDNEKLGETILPDQFY